MNDRTEREEMAILRNRIAMLKAYEANVQQDALEAKIRHMETANADLRYELILQRRVSYGAVALVAIACILLGMRL